MLYFRAVSPGYGDCRGDSRVPLRTVRQDKNKTRGHNTRAVSRPSGASWQQRQGCDSQSAGEGREGGSVSFLDASRDAPGSLTSGGASRASPRSPRSAPLARGGKEMLRRHIRKEVDGLRTHNGL